MKRLLLPLFTALTFLACAATPIAPATTQGSASNFGFPVSNAFDGKLDTWW